MSLPLILCLTRYENKRAKRVLNFLIISYSLAVPGQDAKHFVARPCSLAISLFFSQLCFTLDLPSPLHSPVGVCNDSGSRSAFNTKQKANFRFLPQRLCQVLSKKVKSIKPQLLRTLQPLLQVLTCQKLMHLQFQAPSTKRMSC